MQHLSGVDASFLHLETPETPMHVGSLMLFDLPKGYKGDFYDDVKALIADRMHLASIFHRKLAQMPFELAEPVWIEDDDIDLDYHVRSVTLRKPGSMAQLEALVARLHSTLLDRSRPLWEVYVIDGLASGQIGYYTKAHHSGIDGKAGVEMAKAFYDPTPEVRKVRPPPVRRGGRAYQLGIAELLRAAVSNAATQYAKVGRMVPTGVKALNTVRKILKQRQQVPGERSLNLGLAPKTPFNVSITNQRSYSTLSLPLDELKALGRRAGGTVNTVVMAMSSGALRRYLAERNELPDKPLIAMVPVSLRAADDDSMNNQVSAIRVDLATELADPAAALQGHPPVVRGRQARGQRAQAGARRRHADHRLALVDDRPGVVVWPLEPGLAHGADGECDDLQRARFAGDAVHGRREDGELLPGVDPVPRCVAEHHGAKLRRQDGIRRHRVPPRHVTGRGA